MTLGEKIKKARSDRRMTQAEVAGDAVTRNMLSLIESGAASPSFETLTAIAKKLELPLAYFLSEGDDPFVYLKEERMPAVRRAFAAGRYEECIRTLTKLGGEDDETAYLLAFSYFERGRRHTRMGNLTSALADFDSAKQYIAKTSYDTVKIRALLPLYTAVAHNITTPLLEFEAQSYEAPLRAGCESDFFHYVTLDASWFFTDPVYREHMEAKRLIKQKKYAEAIPHLLTLEENKSRETYQVFVMLGVYTDLQLCYQELCDFEKAYRYSSKRLSLLESCHS